MGVQGWRGAARALGAAVVLMLGGCADAILYPNVAPEENLAAAPPPQALLDKAAETRARLAAPFFLADAQGERAFGRSYRFFARSQFHRALAVSKAGLVAGGGGNYPTAEAAQTAALDGCNKRQRDRGRLADCVIVAVDDAVLRSWQDDLGRALAEATQSRVRYAIGPFVYENDRSGDRSRNGTGFWGPQRAKGVIVFSHGFGGNCSSNILDEIHPFLYKLNEAGWDVLRFDRDPCWESNHQAIYHQYNARLPLLKAAGYRRVVLTGQSTGGSIALGLLTWSNASVIDGVIDVVGSIPLAPDMTYLPDLDTEKDEGQDNRLRQFKMVIDRIAKPIPVVLIEFPGDEYFKRAKEGFDYADERFRAAGIPHLMIYPRSRYTGHFAAGTVAFADDFQDCIQAFIEAGVRGTACPSL